MRKGDSEEAPHDPGAMPHESWILWDGPVCRIIRASRRTWYRAATSRAGVTESVDVAVSNTAAARHGDSTSPPGTKNKCQVFQVLPQSRQAMGERLEFRITLASRNMVYVFTGGML